MASTLAHASPSKDKGKASGSSSFTLKVPPPAIPPASPHPSLSGDDDDDDDDDKLVEPVKHRVKITPLNPIAPPSLSQLSAGSGKKGVKPLVEHELFDADKHRHWSTSVSLPS